MHAMEYKDTTRALRFKENPQVSIDLRSQV
jgi:hypothetical protein